MNYLFITTIKLYKFLVSPVLSRWVHCKFYPTCSDYAIEALNKYGTVVGLKKTVTRLRRCNPYNGESCIDYP
jgi:hypothetical protein